MLYEERRLYETYNKGLTLVPTAELPWYRLTWDRQPDRARGRARSTSTRALVEELLDRIRRDGPLSSTDVEPRASIDWYWRPTNQVRAILEALGEAGILGLSRRDGNRRVYDLVERLFPATCSPGASPSATSVATSCCRATAPTACSAAAGRPSLAGHGAAREPAGRTAGR